MRVWHQLFNRWPVGPADVLAWDSQLGHRDEYSPAEYGDYIATSNDVYACINLRARHMGSLPVRLYQGDDEDKRAVTSGQAFDLLRMVNPFWTFSRLMRMTELSMCLWGESFWAVERPRFGQPREMWWLKSDRVHPVPHEDRYLAGFKYESLSGEILDFAPDEVIWHRYPNPLDEFAGLSPLAAARLAADTSSAMQKSNRNLFSQGLQLGGVITPPNDRMTFSQEQAEELERGLQSRFAGTDKAHKWAVLRFEAQMQQMAVTPKDAEFVAGMNLSFRQVCKAYGVPPPLLGDMEHATLANVRELQLSLWMDALVPDAMFYADDLKEQLLPMFRQVGRGAPRQPDHIEFDFAHVPVLQEAKTATWDRDRQALEVGALTINEWRRKQGMPAVAWGDVWWAPVNKAAVDGPESQIAGDTSGDAPTEESLARLIQQIYLGVDKVVTWDEAREILNRHGAGLDLGTEQPEPAALHQFAASMANGNGVKL